MRPLETWDLKSRRNKVHPWYPHIDTTSSHYGLRRVKNAVIFFSTLFAIFSSSSILSEKIPNPRRVRYVRVKVGYVIFNRELVQTSPFDHFYRSDPRGTMHLFSPNFLRRMGREFSCWVLVYSFTIQLFQYICVCTETLGCYTPTALCQILTLDKNDNSLDWSNCILTFMYLHV